jgi:POT family proton-dependent oligopeptide transporter
VKSGSPLFFTQPDSSDHLEAYRLSSRGPADWHPARHDAEYLRTHLLSRSPDRRPSQTMAFEPLFLLALFTLILGNGAFKPNISTQVGGLYAPGDHRRDRAYSIFYVGINVGAFLAPLVCGTLGEELGWHYGFAAAGVGMTIALAVYLYAVPMLPPDEMHKAKAAGLDKKPLDRNEWRAVLALITLFLPTTFFWATYEQQGNTIALWADEHTDRTIDLIVWHGEIPP